MLRKNKRMPDVLDCLANLSNDEVFTPPEIANKMLDLLPQEVFTSKETTFLDPFTKSGVFLREITKRLLTHQIPNYEEMSGEINEIEKTAIQNAVMSRILDLQDADYDDKAKKIGRDAIATSPRAFEFYLFEEKLQKELNRILKTQVFGIAITELTAQLTRRSLYCSKNASGKYSIGTEFSNEAGNIRFVPMKHSWDKKPNPKTGKYEDANCVFCGISSNAMDRPDDLEQYAYELIHTKNVKEIYNMKFTVVCGNPPYHMADGGGTGDSAKPIYNKFIQAAKALNPQYITMIVPSRWMKGGKGLDKFRQEMINDTKISYLYDFENAKECFPNINLDGGVCYFLRDASHSGKLQYIYKSADGEIVDNERFLKNNVSDLVIRDYRQISIIEKIKAANETAFSANVSAQKPYGFRADTFNRPENYPDAHLSLTERKNAIKIFGVKGKKGGAKRIVGWVDTDSVTKNNDSIEKYKLFFSKAYSSNAINFPAVIQAKPKEICTETFLKIGDFQTETEMLNCYNYMHTDFFKALLFFNRSGMNNSQGTFDLIPWQDFTKSYTDENLYKKYKFTQSEIDFITKFVQKGKKDEKTEDISEEE